MENHSNHDALSSNAWRTAGLAPCFVRPVACSRRWTRRWLANMADAVPRRASLVHIGDLRTVLREHDTTRVEGDVAFHTARSTAYPQPLRP